MDAPVLIAGIGNIFQGDDGFGVAVARKLADAELPESVRVMDTGIRGIDLCFGLLDGYEMTILIDATRRGGEPGTLYTIEINPEEIPGGVDMELPNSHGLNPMCVLAMARRMGARFGRILMVGCEPLVVDCDDTGEIGLSEAVERAVDPAVGIVCDLVREFEINRREIFSYAVSEDCGDCDRGAGRGGSGAELA
jgi:hydrogenase maturation protease